MLVAAAGSTAALFLGTAPPALAQTVAAANEGSLHVQCDGFPNNMSTGEGVARFLGAVTLLGLFAPPPESADASKRKFGADGVAACSSLLDGDKPEGNIRRRIPLILARALHRIEEKNYDAAIADIGKARAEAEAAGLTADPYFNRSVGLSFDQIEAAALVRNGQVAEAMRISLGDVPQHRFSLMPLLSMRSYAEVAPLDSDADVDHAMALARLSAGAIGHAANRLEELRRFDESVAIRSDLVAYESAMKDKDGKNDLPSTESLARLALAEALAGRWDAAAASAQRAREIDAQRLDEGKPEEMATRLQTSEVLDLYDVLLLAHGGNVEGARRKFTARTQWLAPSFGAVMAANVRLYDGAEAADRTGALAKPAAELWNERATARRAELLAKDSDNKTLFHLIEPYVSGSAFEAQSRQVWRTDKSRLFLKIGEGRIDPDAKLAMLHGVQTDVALDAILLHAALYAKADGKKGFTFMPIVKNYIAGIVHVGNPEDPGMPPSLFLDSDAVIAALSPVIPDPVTLKARRAARSR